MHTAKRIVNGHLTHAPETIALARALWDAGLSTAEIGLIMNVTKNAIVGIAHRNDFPARPSPIKRAA